MAQEPSVLDFIKSLFKKDVHIDIRQYIATTNPKPKEELSETENPAFQKIFDKNQKVFVILGFLIIIGSQIINEYHPEKFLLGLLGYCAGGIVLLFSLPEKLFGAQKNILSCSENTAWITHKLMFFIACIILLGSFGIFDDNRFTLINFTLWVAGLVFLIFSLWKKNQNINMTLTAHHNKNFIFALVFVCITTLAFRIYKISMVPAEMWSDHAEKLLDVIDIIDGQTSIFFIRNTGREPLQFYLAALLIKIFHLKFSFLPLKLTTVLAGLATLPFIYIFGKEFFNKWVGLSALFFTGIGYWPNIISRVGLRYAFYPLFSIPVVYFLAKGLIERNRNMVILAGISLGLGLHGYSAARILPALVLMIGLVFILHNRKQSDVKFGLESMVVVAGISFAIFLPLFRFWMENPDLFNYRSFSRLIPTGENESSVFLIFIKNTWRAITMFFYDNGEIWVHSIPNRPALDIITASLFFTGIIYSIKKYKKQRRWLEISLLISIPILMLPSILSVAFPGENPCLNRTAGVYPVVFIFTGIGLTGLFETINGVNSSRLKKIFSGTLLIIIIIISIVSNFQLVFDKYHTQFLLNSWNTSELGSVIRVFIDQNHSEQNAFVIPYPHWVDTRLVGMQAGLPRKDFALPSEAIPNTKEIVENKLFLINPEDSESLELLKKFYPSGIQSIYYSNVPTKEFIIFNTNPTE